MSLLVKICGVTTAKDAAMAAELGADAIGINFWPGSKRYVEPADARAIVDAIPSGVLKVGVFVNAPAEEVAQRMVGAGARPRPASRRRAGSGLSVDRPGAAGAR